MRDKLWFRILEVVIFVVVFGGLVLVYGFRAPWPWDW